LRRADVGLGRAGAHRHPDARFGDVDAAARHDLAGLDEIIDRGARHDDQVIGFAGCDPLLHVERAGEGGGDRMSGRLLELRHQFPVGLLGRLGGEHLDLDRAGGAGR